MKAVKTGLVALVAFVVVGVASADIAVSLSNSGGVYYDSSGGFSLTVTAQLILVEGDPLSGFCGEYGVRNYGMNENETLLSSFTTAPGFAGTWGGQGVGVYSVPQNGKLYVRVYDNSASPGVCLWGWQHAIDVDGALTLYDSFSTATIYNTDGLLGGDEFSKNMGAIPEPASATLMGFVSCGFLFVRRLFPTV